MKKISAMLAVVLVLVLVLSVAGCSKKADASLTGVWEYADEENAIDAIYDLKNDGTGTYTMKVGEEEVTYELKYEVKDGHLLVTYVNNETSVEKLQEQIKAAGIEATLPPAHECEENK